MGQLRRRSGALPTAIIGLLPVLTVLGVVDQSQVDIVRDGINSAVQGVGGLIAIGGVIYSAYGRLASCRTRTAEPWREP